VRRLQAIGDYLHYFRMAYPTEIGAAGDINIVHVGNAIAAYEDVAFRAIDSPFDRYLRGDRQALSGNALAGARLFYGRAGCGRCHSGPLQTDHGYHAIGVPQIGPGKGDPAPGGDAYADFGRERVTVDPTDRYRFRTPSLRNVALTGPWSHDGAYNSLEAMVRHHLDPVAALEGYDPSQLVLPSRPDLDAIDLVNHDNPVNRADIAAAIDPLLLLPARTVTDEEIGLLLEFLRALTDTASLDLRITVPMSVPSGLPLAD
jgi:cytochrome c peroxidase